MQTEELAKTNKQVTESVTWLPKPILRPLFALLVVGIFSGNAFAQVTTKSTSITGSTLSSASCFSCSGQQTFQWLDCNTQCHPIGLKVTLGKVSEYEFYNALTDKCENFWQPTQYQTFTRIIEKEASYTCSPVSCSGTAWCSAGKIGWSANAPTGRRVYERKFFQLFSESLTNCTAASGNQDPTFYVAKNIFDQLSSQIQFLPGPYGTEVVIKAEPLSTSYTSTPSGSLKADVWSLAAGPGGGAYAATERGIFVAIFNQAGGGFSTQRLHSGTHPQIPGTRHWAIASNPSNAQEFVFSNLSRETVNRVTSNNYATSSDSGRNFSQLTAAGFRSLATNAIKFQNGGIEFLTFGGLVRVASLTSLNDPIQTLTSDEGLVSSNVTDSLYLTISGQSSPAHFVGSTIPGVGDPPVFDQNHRLALAVKRPGENAYQPVNVQTDGRALSVSSLAKVRTPAGQEYLFVGTYGKICQSGACRPTGDLFMSPDGGQTFIAVKLGESPQQGQTRRRAVFALHVVKNPTSGQDHAIVIGTKSDDSSSGDGQNDVQTRLYIMFADHLNPTSTGQVSAMPIMITDESLNQISNGDLDGTARAFATSNVSVNGQLQSHFYIGTKR